MRILLVDDDTDLLGPLQAILQELPGHDVRTASTGGSALQAIGVMGGIDVLITDVVMEPMNGFALRDQLQTRFPKAKVIFISGYDLSDYEEQTAGHALLQKPIDAQALKQAVEKELAALAPVPGSVRLNPEQAAAARRAAAQQAAAAQQDDALAQTQPLRLPPQSASAGAATVKAGVPVARGSAVAASPMAQAAPTVKAATPVAVPRTPSAAPVAQPVARAATPTAQPVAQPVARPAATPVAQPVARAATPMAQPVARAAAPVAQPVARASTPVPAATPVAQPVARAVTPVAQPAAVPVAVPRKATQPQARVVLPTNTPAPRSIPVPLPGAGSAGADPLIGTNFGGYQILGPLGQSRWGAVYSAVQNSINRPVALRTLSAELAADPEQKARFIADARAKAHVQHPAVLAVYEAGEHEGQSFCAQEFVEGKTLAYLQQLGHKLDEPAALKIMRAVAEGMAYFQSHELVHSPLDANAIYLAKDGHPRLANLAAHSVDEALTPTHGIQVLGRMLLGMLPPAQSISPGLRAMLGRMVQTGANAITAWSALLQGVKALEPKVVPVEAAKISAQDQAAIQAVEAARRAQKRSFWVTAGVMSATLGLVVWAVWTVAFKSNERFNEAQIEIQAGSYPFGPDKTKVNLETFWIDKYEVTIGQYAKFLQYIEKHPTAEADFNHPKQPRQLDHHPENWNIYYLNAVVGKAAHGVPMSLNSPVMMVTWWDAYAYAKWKNRELPTEQEWEAAARGPEGLIYPWGNEFQKERVNANSDYNPRDPAAPGKVDGFNFWGDVDLMKSDKSPAGCIGMAGNVSEWVAWPPGSGTPPMYKGGSFKSADPRLDKRVTDHPPAKGEEWIGFRTISRTPPKK